MLVNHSDGSTTAQTVKMDLSASDYSLHDEDQSLSSSKGRHPLTKS